jgi:uncharacterized LabA/DUF88 family protein
LSKNVAVFVDVANIFYAAKAAGVDIDYVTLLKSAGAGRDLVRAYAYTGLDPDNENQRNFHDFLRRHGYKVVSKDIRKYGDGKVKANLDIELVVDMMKTARNLDIAIVVSGDGDFAPAIRAVQEMGVRVEVISFRGNTSSDLIEVADQFTDITQLARVEKGSRSGRRVAGDDADLSMTEVPDKQTEGTGVGRGGRTTRGRGRGRAGEAETAVAASSARGRGRRPAAASTNGSGGDGLTAMPGERLAKAGGLSESELAAAEVFTLDDLSVPGGVSTAEGVESAEGEGETYDDAGRRRRRRGGRGRGRGRGREEAAGAPTAASPERAPTPARFEPADEEDDEPMDAPRPPRSTPFGSVWDSQLGTSVPPAANLSPLADDEDFEEPEIPEYLIAEQRRGARGAVRGQGGGRGGPRGGRAAYQSAMERERYGRGRSGGINRYPDVSGRGADRGADRQRGGRGYEGQDQRPRESARPSGSAEPWSEVPPELEAMLRAQVGQRPATRPTEITPGQATEIDAIAIADVPSTVVSDATVTTDKPAPKRRTSRSSTSKARTASTTAGATDADAAPKRRTTRKGPSTAADDAGATAAPKRRTTRKSASAGADAATGSVADGAAGEETADEGTPKRRTTRRTTAKPAS